jgi:Fic family protein
MLDALPAETQEEAIIDIILAEAIKTSAIEGEYPNKKDVLSSIRKNLGLHCQANNTNQFCALTKVKLL